jgi:hypothetical protein
VAASPAAPRRTSTLGRSPLLLLHPRARRGRRFRLLNYITVRAAAAFVTGAARRVHRRPAIIRRLRAMAVHQVVTDGTPITHAAGDDADHGRE